MGRTFVSLLALAAVASATVSSAGQTLVVDGISYYAAPEAVTIISATADMLAAASRGTDTDLVPLAVLVDSSSQFTTDVFRSIVSNYTSSDDVFNTGFLQGMCFKSSFHNPNICQRYISRTRDQLQQQSSTLLEQRSPNTEQSSSCLPEHTLPRFNAKDTTSLVGGQQFLQAHTSCPSRLVKCSKHTDSIPMSRGPSPRD